MITSEQREKVFRKDLKKLLDKHNSEIGIDPDTGLPEVVMWTLRNKDDEILEDFSNFIL